jgi:hypothetical protein
MLREPPGGPIGTPDDEVVVLVGRMNRSRFAEEQMPDIVESGERRDRR